MTAIGLKLSVVGLSETVAALEEVPKAIQRRVLVKAIRAGGAPFLDAVRRLAPSKSRNLRRSLTLLVRRYRSGTVVAVIGQEKGKQFKSIKRRRSGIGGLSAQGKAVPIHFVENPVRSHRIPKNAQVAGGKRLRFRWGGKWVTVPYVDHPGTAGTGFVKHAAAASEAAAIQAFSEKDVLEGNAELDAIAAKATRK